MGIDLPPLRFDHPFRGEVMVIEHTQAEMAEACFPFGGEACAKVIQGPAGPICLIPTLRGHAKDATLRRHEIAHCNGWPADHPP